MPSWRAQWQLHFSLTSQRCTSAKVKKLAVPDLKVKNFNFLCNNNVVFV
jgi:hypothetical protein